MSKGKQAAYVDYYSGAPTFKKKKTGSGDLRIPVDFMELTPNADGEPGDMPTKMVFSTYAQVYAPSQKDTLILSTHDRTEGVTIRIRDTRGEFLPTVDKHAVYIDDYRYKDKIWDITDVRLDFSDDSFLVLVLSNPQGGDSDGAA